jgi:hypothetical protein
MRSHPEVLGIGTLTYCSDTTQCVRTAIKFIIIDNVLEMIEGSEKLNNLPKIIHLVSNKVQTVRFIYLKYLVYCFYPILCCILKYEIVINAI